MGGLTALRAVRYPSPTSMTGLLAQEMVSLSRNRSGAHFLVKN